MPEPTYKDTTDWLTQFNELALRKMTVDLDRDVTLPLAGSDCQQFNFTQPQKQQLLKQEWGRFAIKVNADKVSDGLTVIARVFCGFVR